MSLSARMCPFCEARAFMRASLPMPTASLIGRPQARFASTAQRRVRSKSQQPSRMALSPKVASSRPAQSQTDNAKPKPSRSPGAFGGMNQTHPGLRVLLEKQRAERVQEIRDKRKRPDFRNEKSKKPARKPGDMRALKMQRALSAVPYAQRSMVKGRIDAIKSFEEFPLLPGIHKALAETLAGQEDVKPTPIQRLAIPAILGLADSKGRKVKEIEERGKAMQQFLLAAETGSGKTLAYLIPTMQATKRAELQEKEEASVVARIEDKERNKRNPLELDSPILSSEQDVDAGRPRAIILLPTAELVEQVGALFKLFSHNIKQRIAVISANYTATVIRSRLFSPSGVDIVVSTPHLLQSIATTTPHILSRVTHLVVDEADSLMDRSFAPITSDIIDRATPSLQSLILASATIPRSLDGYLRDRFPGLARLTTPNLHAIPRRVVLSVVDIDAAPYNSSRDLACADAIWQIGRGAADDARPGDERRVLVFVNERAEAARLASYLQAKGVDAAALSRDTADARAGDLLAAFTAPASERRLRDADEAFAAAPRERTPDDARFLRGTKALVVTDIASRGIDTLAVRHVVLYDVPHTSIDFIHRLGRTGRMGRRGRGIVLAGKTDRKDVIREVREAMFRGSSLI